jgi:soluble lytic murein transglycosylase-like protein
MKISTRKLLAVCTPTVLALAVMFSPLSASAHHSERKRSSYKPSRAQLERLSELEPYIRYFTSLSYGPAETKVAADYIRALILTESGADPSAQSKKGARGLTQITSTTAARVAADLKEAGVDYLYIDEAMLDEFHADHLHDPALNILIACYLNATYHHWYDGRRDLMISAWNAGPGAVRRYGNKPPPYPETQATIFKVESYLSYLEEGGL